MNILLVAATKLEIKPFIAKINKEYEDIPESIFLGKHSIDLLITGVGMVFTTYHLTKTLNQKKYDLIINAGIAGSFSRDLNIGEVVFVLQEEFGDLGIEDPSGFSTLFEKGFINKNEMPFTNGFLKNTFPDKFTQFGLKAVKGLTSNMAHGNEINIKQLKDKFNPDIETMEGAAFLYVCLNEKVDFIQIRAISNYVEARDTSKWNIPLAIENLSIKLIEIIERI